MDVCSLVSIISDGELFVVSSKLYCVKSINLSISSVIIESSMFRCSFFLELFVDEQSDNNFV